MLRFLFPLLFLFLLPSWGSARAVRVGDTLEGGPSLHRTFGGPSREPAAVAEISCFENEDCSDDQECVALRCESVCKNSICSAETHCVPAGKEKPHDFKCVQCVGNFHCETGMICDADYTCKKPDPCLTSVCSPAAPYCMPKPYKTLPYTCVQCLTDEHCPPVAGLTRSCIDGYCLFNVEGNIPKKKQTKKDARSVKD